MNYYVGDNVYGNDLYHHGIKGQKWGIRRFQNEDGSLTEAGIARYRYAGSSRFFGGAGRKQNAAAREELGLNRKKRKNSATENRIAEQYAATKKGIKKYQEQTDTAKSLGFAKDAEKGRRAVKSLEKELGALKMELSNYNKLPEAGKKKIDKGYKTAKTLLAVGFVVGGYPFAVASAAVKTKADLRKQETLRGR